MHVHLVLVKLKPGVARTDPAVVAWETLLAGLPRRIPGIVRWETGWNTTARDIAYDFGINSAFATREELDAYGPHPAHQEVVRRLREIADWVICDYELGEWITD
jgi:stress responsive alpha/beta barrel protein